MNENEVKTENKSFFNVKMVLRILATICIVVVFCPAFLVSCSGEDISVGAMTAIEGVSLYGEEISEPHPEMAICIIIPIAILVLLFVKNLAGKKAAGIILGCTVVDFIIWLVFRAKVKEIAEEGYCTFKVTGWFVINIISMLLIIILCCLILAGRCIMESDLRQIFTGQKIQTVGQTVPNMAADAAAGASAVSGKKEEETRVCPKCGATVAKGYKYCISCGAAVPENITVQAPSQQTEE